MCYSNAQMIILGKSHETKLKVRFFEYENKLFSKQ